MRPTSRILTLSVLSLLLAAPLAWGKTPVSPNASPATKRLVDRIQRLHAAGYTLSGQQIGFEPWLLHEPQVNERRNEYEHVRVLTGKRPAILAVDLNTAYQHADRRTGLIRLLKAHGEAGGIVQLSWHAARPTQDNPDAGAPDTAYSELTSAQWTALVDTVFAETFYNWRDHIEFAAGFLRELEQYNIPILWRPYHEAEGNWFWWGQTAQNSPENYRKLWTRLFQAFNSPGDHNLKNVAWVYSAAFPGNSPTFPGREYVDFSGFDYYTNSATDPLFVQRDQLVRNFGSGPAALTETGLLPATSLLYPRERSARYTWVLVWYGGDLDRTYYGAPPSGTLGNSPKEIRAFYAHPRTVTLENLWTILERRPKVKIKGSKNITTSAASRTVKVKVNKLPITPQVQYKAPGNKSRKVATKRNGQAKFRIKLRRPLTKVKVRGISSSKVRSKWVVMRIHRKS